MPQAPPEHPPTLVRMTRHEATPPRPPLPCACAAVVSRRAALQPSNAPPSRPPAEGAIAHCRRSAHPHPPPSLSRGRAKGQGHRRQDTALHRLSSPAPVSPSDEELLPVASRGPGLPPAECGGSALSAGPWGRCALLRVCARGGPSLRLPRRRPVPRGLSCVAFLTGP